MGTNVVLRRYRAQRPSFDAPDRRTSRVVTLTRSDAECVQDVTVHRVADRHAAQHERVFASTHAVVVFAGSLDDVLRQIAQHVQGFERGRYVVTIDWPKEPDG